MLANNNEYNKRCHDNRVAEEVDNGRVDRGISQTNIVIYQKLVTQ